MSLPAEVSRRVELNGVKLGNNYTNQPSEQEILWSVLARMIDDES
jgi:hypothetical protein